MDQQEKGKDNMHKNLIKITDLLAFANNSDGVISLLSKKTKDYSFEDIINKEQEIDDLNKKIKDLNTEKDNAIDTQKALIIKVLNTIGMILDFLLLLVFGGLSIFVMFTIGIAPGALLLLLEFTFIWFYKQIANENKEEKAKIRNTKEIEEALEQVRKLINSKKEELERILNQVDFREYSNRDEIERILSNMFNINQSKEYHNTLNNDLSNTTTLDGPTLNRRKDV